MFPIMIVADGGYHFDRQATVGVKRAGDGAWGEAQRKQAACSFCSSYPQGWVLLLMVVILG